MRIYTRAGDQGQTGLIGGAKLSKNDAIFDALGDLDELNATIGVARSCPKCHEWALDAYMDRIQSLLFEVGAEIAALKSEDERSPADLGDITTDLEHSIDMEMERLPALTNFVLPGGTEMASRLHLARAKARRAERSIIAVHAVAPVRAELLSFLNRLSDWFFVAARVANFEAGISDVIWKRS